MKKLTKKQILYLCLFIIFMLLFIICCVISIINAISLNQEVFGISLAAMSFDGLTAVRCLETLVDSLKETKI